MASSDVQRFVRLIGELEARVKRLEAGARTSQLSHSSLEDAGLPAYDAQGTLRQVIGRQSDGTFAVTYANGDKPPRPTAPVVSARQLAVVVGWDGQFEGSAARPGDFARVDVHMAADPDFVPDGSTLYGSLIGEGAVVIPADVDTHYIKMVAVTLSDVPSEATAAVEVTALPADQLAAGSVTADQLAAEIVLVNKKIIAGAPDGRRLEMSETGLAQYVDGSDPVVRLGQDGSGNSFGVVGRTYIRRINLCENPKVQNNIALYDTGRGTLTRVPGDRVGAEWALRMTGDGVNSNPYIGYGLHQQPAQPGQTYALQVMVSASVAMTLTLGVDGTDADGTYIAVKSERIDVPANTPTRLSMTVVAPDALSYLHTYVSRPFVATPVPTTEFWDQSLLCLELADTVEPYFDGDTPSDALTEVSWLGTPGSSESQMLVYESESPQPLALLSDTGDMSVQNLTVTDDLIVGGQPLLDLVDAAAGHIVAWGELDYVTPYTTTEIGVAELTFTAVSGRLYRFMSSTLSYEGTASGFRVRYTEDGTRPTVTNSIIWQGFGSGENANSLFGWNDGVDRTIRVLITVRASGDSSARARADKTWLGAAGFRMWVEDAGAYVEPSAIPTDGGGTEAPPEVTYETTWKSTWARAFNQHGRRTDGQYAQGYYPDGYNGDNMVMFGFNDADIRSKLSGAKVNSVKLYLYSNHWYYNSGGVACIGAHNVSSAPGSYSYAWRGMKEHSMKKPQGLWIKLPVQFGRNLRDGKNRGIVLDARYKGHNLLYYGKFNASAQLRINYTK